MYYNTDICVAAGQSVIFTPESLAKHFKNYVNGKEGFISFCKGENSWRAPNASLVRLNYCPFTGTRIDWKLVLEEGLKYFED